MIYARLLDVIYLQREKISFVVAGLCVLFIALFVAQSTQQMVLQPPEAPSALEMVAMLEFEQPADEMPQNDVPEPQEETAPEPEPEPESEPLPAPTPEPTPVALPPEPPKLAKPIVRKMPTKPPKPVPKPVQAIKPQKKVVQQQASTQSTPTDNQSVKDITPVNASATPPKATPQQIEAAASVKKSANYSAFVVAYLKKHQKYPTGRQASELRPKGTATVWFVINRAGEVLDYGIESSSRANILDRAAKKLVRRAKFPPFPDGAFPGEANHRFIAHLKYEKK